MKVLIINLVVFSFLLAGLEAVFHLVNLLDRDPPLIPWPRPAAEELRRDYTSKEQITSWHFRDRVDPITGDNWRRHTPNQPKTNAKQAFVFLGGSFAYGTGVDENQTIPYYLSRLVSDAKSYNYGIPGTGPAHVLYTLKNHPELFNDILEKRVTGIFIFITEHIARTTLGFSYMTWAPPNPPEYWLEQGQLRGGQLLLFSNPLKYFFYFFLKRSSVGHFLMNRRSWFSPERRAAEYQDEDILLTAQVLKKIEIVFKRVFPQSEFIVYLLPRTKPIVSAFKEADLTIELSEIISSREEDFLPDGHLSPLGNNRVARQLARILGD